jgi:hypothetical protein
MGAKWERCGSSSKIIDFQTFYSTVVEGVHNQVVAPSSQPPQLSNVVRQHSLGDEVVGAGGVQVEHRLGSMVPRPTVSGRQTSFQYDVLLRRWSGLHLLQLLHWTGVGCARSVN